jgi:hypothetical protein
MRFLADENFPFSALRLLAASGHDVVWLRKDSPGLSDVEVLRKSIQDKRILLTFDKDFGELTRHIVVPKTSGVILFRMPLPPAAEAGARLAAIIDGRSDWLGSYSVVSRGRIRMRPFTESSGQ